MELWKENYEKIEPTKEEREGKYERIDKLNTQAADITNISQEDLGVLGGTLIARYPVRKLNIRQKRIYWYCECPYCGAYKYVLSAEVNALCEMEPRSFKPYHSFIFILQHTLSLYHS